MLNYLYAEISGKLICDALLCQLVIFFLFFFNLDAHLMLEGEGDFDH